MVDTYKKNVEESSPKNFSVTSGLVRLLSDYWIIFKLGNLTFVRNSSKERVSFEINESYQSQRRDANSERHHRPIVVTRNQD